GLAERIPPTMPDGFEPSASNVNIESVFGSSAKRRVPTMPAWSYVMSRGSDSITVTGAAVVFWQGVLGTSTTTSGPRSGDASPASTSGAASPVASRPASASTDEPPEPPLPPTPEQLAHPVVSRLAGGG